VLYNPKATQKREKLFISCDWRGISRKFAVYYPLIQPLSPRTAVRASPVVSRLAIAVNNTSLYNQSAVPLAKCGYIWLMSIIAVEFANVR
jgi:hypothetical protein